MHQQQHLRGGAAAMAAGLWTGGVLCCLVSSGSSAECVAERTSRPSSVSRESERQAEAAERLDKLATHVTVAKKRKMPGAGVGGEPMRQGCWGGWRPRLVTFDLDVRPSPFDALPLSTCCS